MRPRTDRHTNRHTDARDHNTFVMSISKLVRVNILFGEMEGNSLKIALCLFICYRLILVLKFISLFVPSRAVSFFYHFLYCQMYVGKSK